VSRAALRCLVLAFALVGLGASAQEQIHSYDARIDVARDGTLTITETIAVVAAGEKIRRGIYRDFPTRYRGRFGERVIVPFDVVRVARDGRPESHHLKTLQGGVRLYIGKHDENVSKGPHTYEITYRTRRQLGFFEDHDELYWNVTGNFWDFPILHASATVRLPDGLDPAEIKAEGYTGATGSKARDLIATVDATSGYVHFETTRPLARHEGLTIVAQFQKGIVEPPSGAELHTAFIDANRPVLVAAVGGFAVLAYFTLVWIGVGRDPVRGTIVPRFEPPARLSPAAMRHLMRMGYDEVCFATAIVSMAVKGFLTIEEKSGEYTLVRAATDRKLLSLGEKRIADGLLTKERFTIRHRDHAKIRAAVATFRDWLAIENEGGLFRANRGWFLPGAMISALAVAATAFATTRGAQASADGIPVLILIVWVLIWSLAIAALALKVVAGWRTALRAAPGGERFKGWLVAGLQTAFAAPFFFAEIMGLALLAQATSILLVGSLTALLVPNLVFYQLLKRPTRAGRHLMDEIEGFKLYLKTAEGDDIRQIEGPKPTPELFEHYLPYALALGVENEWAARFADVLERAGQDSPDGYAPHWYHGRSFSDVGAHAFAASLGSSLGGAVASNSRAPGSASGGGGGGSSGGGGGGGGGGGW
jgi:uncharacterized membrane protein YgcG